MSCTSCPLLANGRGAAQGTHSLLGKLRKHWKEMVVSVALSFCSIQCDIVTMAHADLPIKLRVKVVHAGRCGNYVKMVHLVGKRAHTHLE